MKRLLLLLSSSLIFAFLFIGCTTAQLLIDNNKKVDSLGLKITYNQSVDKESIQELNKYINQFIREHNSSKHKFILKRADRATTKCLSVSINSIDYVSTSKQIFSSLVTLAGPATFYYTMSNPDLGFWVIWWWFPRYELKAELYLSRDISLNSDIVSRTIDKFHWYTSVKGQRETLGKLFKDSLHDTFEQLEKQ